MNFRDCFCGSGGVSCLELVSDLGGRGALARVGSGRLSLPGRVGRVCLLLVEG